MPSISRVLGSLSRIAAFYGNFNPSFPKWFENGIFKDFDPVTIALIMLIYVNLC